MVLVWNTYSKKDVHAASSRALLARDSSRIKKVPLRYKKKNKAREGERRDKRRRAEQQKTHLEESRIEVSLSLLSVLFRIGRGSGATVSVE